MTLSEIKAVLESNPTVELLKIIREDSRAGAQKLLASYEKNQQLQQDEILRMENMYQYERSLYSKGCKFVAGVDEAGRGPLAGPLVVAAVILQENQFFYGLNDSKKVPEKKRNQLFEEILQNAIAVKVEVVPVEIIDEKNIYQATIFGMKEALLGLHVKPDAALIDAMPLTDLPFSTISLVQGDSLSASIAAASILAKVTRDSLMQQLDKIYPDYGFAKNKGYGTKEHMEALFDCGATSEHRVSFEPLKSLINGGKAFEYSRNASTVGKYNNE